MAPSLLNFIAGIKSRGLLLFCFALSLLVTVVDFFGYQNYRAHHGRNLNLAGILAKQLHVSILYEGVLLLLAVLLLLLIVRQRSVRAGPPRGRWLALAALFTALLLLKVTKIDSGAIRWLRTLDRPGAVAVSSSVVFLGMLLAFIALLPFAYKWLAQLEAPHRARFVIAGTLFVSGFVFIEFAGEYFWTFYGGSSSLSYNLSTALENLLEECGLSLFIFALLEYLQVEIRRSREDGAAGRSAPRGAAC